MAPHSLEGAGEISHPFTRTDRSCCETDCLPKSQTKHAKTMMCKLEKIETLTGEAPRNLAMSATGATLI